MGVRWPEWDIGLIKRRLHKTFGSIVGCAPLPHCVSQFHDLDFLTAPTDPYVLCLHYLGKLYSSHSNPCTYLFMYKKQGVLINKCKVKGHTIISMIFQNQLFRYVKGLKVSWFRNGYWGHRFPPKNERINLFLLVCDVFPFVFWRKSTTQKNLFEINWPLTFERFFQECSNTLLAKHSILMWTLII